MSMIASIIGRLLIALMFLVSGIGKVADPTQAAQMLESVNLPGTFAMPVGVFEIVAAVLLAIGLMVRLTAILLAGYVALTIMFFHNDFTDPMGLTEALTHLALIGDNLFDVERRRHASFTKDFVPLAGRNVKLSAKLSF